MKYIIIIKLLVTTFLTYFLLFNIFDYDSFKLISETRNIKLKHTDYQEFDTQSMLPLKSNDLFLFKYATNGKFFNTLKFKDENVVLSKISPPYLCLEFTKKNIAKSDLYTISFSDGKINLLFLRTIGNLECRREKFILYNLFKLALSLFFIYAIMFFIDRILDNSTSNSKVTNLFFTLFPFCIFLVLLFN